MRVSVCIPVRNGAGTLAATIASVMAQDLAGIDLEIVVSDNASTDATPEVVRPFLTDPRVRYHRTEQGLDLFASFQRAAQLSGGEAFVALGSDDVVLPGFLADLVARLDAPGAERLVLAGCAARVIDGEDAPLPLRLRPRPLGRVSGERLRTLMLWTGLNLVGSPSTVLIRRAAFDAVGGFRPDAGYAGDLDLWLRLAAVGDADLSDDELVLYRVHARSFTSSRASGQIASVLEAVRAADPGGPARPLRAVLRGSLVRLAWALRRAAVLRAVRG
jgi:glycosyltransferase involved in cell wall biosynthesis